ncbi:hypothetical protein GW937_01610 [Candidatus Kaiserbacteria bacterium]|nr:hypothetical protein [Candidatus Kaiserbacteria bacterium]NCT01710.1 hypothetical protein [Candidatus Parcubacteria bacterium]
MLCTERIDEEAQSGLDLPSDFLAFYLEGEIMTTLKDGKQYLLEAFQCSFDQNFQERMLQQVEAMTAIQNSQCVWEKLPHAEQQRCGSIENHPQGMELCIEEWIKTGKAEQWGDSYVQTQHNLDINSISTGK